MEQYLKYALALKIPETEYKIVSWQPSPVGWFAHHEPVYKELDESIVKLHDLWLKAEEELQWKHDADRQIFIAAYKVEVRKEVVKHLPPKQIGITINPNPDISDSHKCLKEIMIIVREVLPDCLYCFEQRSIGDEPERGWHIHLSCCSARFPSEISKTIHQKLSGKKVKLNSLVHGQFVNSSWHDEYMQGIKKDKNPEIQLNKAAKVLKDNVLRLKYDIPPIMPCVQVQA